MAMQGSRKPAASGAVLDRVHLARYTMDNAELEREIVGLFLDQLPKTLDMLRRASAATDWKLATHTLKGSAAAVGASAINGIAADLETIGPCADRSALLATLDLAVGEFREAVRRIYP